MNRYIKIHIAVILILTLFGTIAQANTPLIANAGDDLHINITPSNRAIYLDASQSTGTNIKSYKWFYNGTFIGSGKKRWYVMAGKGNGQHTIKLTIQDSNGNIDEDSLVVTVTGDNSTSETNTAPIANAGMDQSNITVGEKVQLNGNASSDTDGDNLVYTWSILFQPIGSNIAVNTTTPSTPSFTPEVAGNYELQLIVNDGHVDSMPDSVVITVSDPEGDENTYRARTAQNAFEEVDALLTRTDGNIAYDALYNYNDKELLVSLPDIFTGEDLGEVNDPNAIQGNEGDHCYTVDENNNTQHYMWCTLTHKFEKAKYLFNRFLANGNGTNGYESKQNTTNYIQTQGQNGEDIIIYIPKGIHKTALYLSTTEDVNDGLDYRRLSIIGDGIDKSIIRPDYNNGEYSYPARHSILLNMKPKGISNIDTLILRDFSIEKSTIHEIFRMQAAGSSTGPNSIKTLIIDHVDMNITEESRYQSGSSAIAVGISSSSSVGKFIVNHTNIHSLDTNNKKHTYHGIALRNTAEAHILNSTIDVAVKEFGLDISAYLLRIEDCNITTDGGKGLIKTPIVKYVYFNRNTLKYISDENYAPYLLNDNPLDVRNIFKDTTFIVKDAVNLFRTYGVNPSVNWRFLFDNITLTKNGTSDGSNSFTENIYIPSAKTVINHSDYNITNDNSTGELSFYLGMAASVGQISSFSVQSDITQAEQSGLDPSKWIMYQNEVSTPIRYHIDKDTKVTVSGTAELLTALNNANNGSQVVLIENVGASAIDIDENITLKNVFLVGKYTFNQVTLDERSGFQNADIQANKISISGKSNIINSNIVVNQRILTNINSKLSIINSTIDSQNSLYAVQGTGKYLLVAGDTILKNYTEAGIHSSADYVHIAKTTFNGGNYGIKIGDNLGFYISESVFNNNTQNQIQIDYDTGRLKTFLIYRLNRNYTDLNEEEHSKFLENIHIENARNLKAYMIDHFIENGYTKVVEETYVMPNAPYLVAQNCLTINVYNESNTTYHRTTDSDREVDADGNCKFLGRTLGGPGFLGYQRGLNYFVRFPNGKIDEEVHP